MLNLKFHENWLSTFIGNVIWNFSWTVALATKVAMQFHTNFIYVIRTLSLIFLWKISFLAQRVHVSEILRHFSQFYPTHSRLVYNPTGMLLAILYGEVPHMLPAKYQPNPPSGSGEEDFWSFFTIFGHGGHLEFRIKTILAIFRSPSAWMLHMKFGSGEEVVWTFFTIYGHGGHLEFQKIIFFS